MAFTPASSRRSTLSGVPLLVRLAVLAILSVPLIGTVSAFRESSARAWSAYVATETAPVLNIHGRRLALHARLASARRP